MRIVAALVLVLAAGCTGYWTPSAEELSAQLPKTRSDAAVAVAFAGDFMRLGFRTGQVDPPEVQRAAHEEIRRVARLPEDGGPAPLAAWFTTGERQPDRGGGSVFLEVLGMMLLGIVHSDIDVQVEVALSDKGGARWETERINLTQHRRGFLPIPLFGSMLLLIGCDALIQSEDPEVVGRACAIALARALEKPPVERAPPHPAPPAPAPPVPSPRPEPVAATGGVHVLVVGVNDYDDPAIPDLRFAEQDARAVYGFFATEARSPTIPERVELVTGKDATRKRILKAIRERLVAGATRPEDTAILYFAGHGFQDATTTYIAGSDAQIAELPETAIPLETIQSYWSQVRAGRKVLITDACHSGGLEGVRGIGGVALPPGADSATQASTLSLAATGPSELSTEDPKLGQGVFTLCLLRGLRGEADADGDRRVTGDELSSYLGREVPAMAARAGGRQTPVARSSAGAGPIFLTR